jgi:hypothetical protein
VAAGQLAERGPQLAGVGMGGVEPDVVVIGGEGERHTGWTRPAASVASVVMIVQVMSHAAGSSSSLPLPHRGDAPGTLMGRYNNIGCSPRLRGWSPEATARYLADSCSPRPPERSATTGTLSCPRRPLG